MIKIQTLLDKHNTLAANLEEAYRELTDPVIFPCFICNWEPQFILNPNFEKSWDILVIYCPNCCGNFWNEDNFYFHSNSDTDYKKIMLHLIENWNAKNNAPLTNYTMEPE